VLMLPPSVRIFFSSEPTDLRRSFDGLAALVREWLGEDPLSGHLFVFRNRGGDRIKSLYWDRSGLCLFYKRLEKGIFRLPPSTGRRSLELECVDMALILEGIDLKDAKRRPRFLPERDAQAVS
jgi:transposase